MGVVHTPDSEYMKELLKWEFDDYRYGEARGLRGPRTYQEFPKMLYKAGRNDRNQIAILSRQSAETPEDERRLQSQGFVFGPEKAIEACEAQEREIATLAANRAYQERTMSPQAQAEAAAVDDSTSDHVPVIPETPRKPRGRQPKTLTAAE